MSEKLPPINSLQDRLSITGANILIDSLNKDMAGELHPAYKGKKLGDLSLEIEYLPSLGRNMRNNVSKLSVQITNPTDIELLESHHSPDISALESMFFADIPLCNGFSIDNNRPWHRATETRFCFNHKATTKPRVLSTIYSNNCLQDLNEALLFCQATEAYVKSSDFNIPYSRRVHQAEQFNDVFRQFRHFWNIPYKPGLIFNGYEPREYLNGYILYAKKAIRETEYNISLIEDSPVYDEYAKKTVQILNNDLINLEVSLASAKNAFDNPRV